MRRLPRVTGRTPRARARATTALAGAAIAGALALSGCSALSPQQTTEPYEPADGVSITLGHVDFNDLLVVTSAKGEPGVVSAQVANQGTSKATVKIAGPGGTDSAQLSVPADSAVILVKRPQGQVTLSSVPVAPGATMTLQVSTASEGTEQVVVPVLLDDGYYATVTPESSPSSGASPSSSGTSSPSTEPSPTSS